MKKDEFLSEFEDDQFPQRLGVEISLDTHDPPFRKADLRQMARAGMIDLDEVTWTYRLTLAATDERYNVKVSRGAEDVPRSAAVDTSARP
jgi:hypothetical protein